MATVYQTIDDFFRVAGDWNSTVMDEISSTSDLSALRVRHEDTNTYTNFSTGKWMAKIGWDRWRTGAMIRHELGHAYQQAIHARKQWADPQTDSDPNTVGDNAKCLSYGVYAAGDPNWTHTEEGCEYGFTAMFEGLATFFAVRSAVDETDGQRAWFCWCADATSICSAAAAVTPTSDSIGACPGGQNTGFVGVGDHYVSNVGDCVRLKPGDFRCDCADDDDNEQCDDTLWHRTRGWRSEAGVYRFMWDMIDSNNEGGQDDTNLEIDDLIAELQAIPCSSTVFGVDGSCNEPNRASAIHCDPYNANQVIPDGSPQTATRDSYSVWDIAEALPGNQADERVLNCVQGAQD